MELVIFKIFIYSYFREKGREGEKEGEKLRCERETWISCLSLVPNRDQTHNLGLCPDQELNQ